MTPNTLLLSREDIKECIDMPACLEIVEGVFRAHGEGNAVMPPKLHLEMDHVDGWINAMPAYLVSQNAAGLKWAGGWGKNRDKGLPYIMAEILLIDPETGLLKSVMEGGYITDLRTGAATGVAAKYLAKKDSKTVAIIGAGKQGRMQLRALHHLFDLEEIRVVDIIQETSRNFVKDMQEELGVIVRESRNPQEAVFEADIIVTATAADEILVKQGWVSKGAFIASIGSYPEIDPQIIFNSNKIIVDSWAQSKHRGELSRLVQEGKIGEENIYGEMGEVVAGKKPGREAKDEIIIACLIGLGSHDIGCAQHVYKKSQKKGLGQTFNFQQLNKTGFNG